MGEQVLIKACVVDVVVEQGKLKYKLRVEHTADELEHLFSDSQILPHTELLGIIEEDEDEEPLIGSGELFPGEFDQDNLS